METFTKTEIAIALKELLEYAERNRSEKYMDESGHFLYFHGNGWGARCIRYHMKHLHDGSCKEDDGLIGVLLERRIKRLSEEVSSLQWLLEQGIIKKGTADGNL